MVRRKKVTASVLAALMAVGSFAGTVSADPCPRNEQGYPDLGGETITIWFAMTSNNAQATSNMEDYHVIKDIEEKFNCGINRIIIGTKAVSDSEFVKRAVDKYGERIVIGIDAKDGMVAVEGWEKTSDFTAVDFAKKMTSIGVKTIVYTDIATDGTLNGPNISAMTEMVKSVNADIIASGGVGSIEHISALIPTGVEGVIIGRALYTGAVDLRKAVNAAK